LYKPNDTCSKPNFLFSKAPVSFKQMDHKFY
jgi:hypothetical protein